MDSIITLDTSCTKDEAVATMLGWSDGPIRFSPRSKDPSQEELDNLPSYCLSDDLNDCLDNLESEYSEAKSRGVSAHEIEQKKSAVADFMERIALARTYRCAIDDELAKENLSALRIDPKRSNSICTYITLTSLKAWAFQTFNLEILPNILTTIDVQAINKAPKEKHKPRTKLRDQEDVILQEISNLGYTPKNLPMDAPGKPGVKAKVRDKLKGIKLFSAKTAFDRAWERLSKDKYISKLK